MEFTPENALPYVEKRHYNRHIKSIKATDGTEGAPLRTRYTDRWKWRLKKRAKEPTYEQFPRMVYYLGGRFYITGDAKIQGKWTQALVRLDGVMWDAHPIQSEEQGIPVVRVWCEDGVPYRADDESGTVWTKRDGLGRLEGMLRITGRAA